MSYAGPACASWCRTYGAGGLQVRRSCGRVQPAQIRRPRVMLHGSDEKATAADVSGHGTALLACVFSAPPVDSTTVRRGEWNSAWIGDILAVPRLLLSLTNEVL